MRRNGERRVLLFQLLVDVAERRRDLDAGSDGEAESCREDRKISTGQDEDANNEREGKSGGWENREAYRGLDLHHESSVSTLIAGEREGGNVPSSWYGSCPIMTTLTSSNGVYLDQA